MFYKKKSTPLFDPFVFHKIRNNNWENNVFQYPVSDLEKPKTLHNFKNHQSLQVKVSQTNKLFSPETPDVPRITTVDMCSHAKHDHLQSDDLF